MAGALAQGRARAAWYVRRSSRVKAMAAYDPYHPILHAHLDDWAAREARQVASGARSLPPDTVAELRASRVLAAPIPCHLEGAGATLAETVQAVRMVARVAPSSALCLAMPLGNAANARIPDAAVPTELQKALARGRAWIAEKALAGRVPA